MIETDVTEEIRDNWIELYYEDSFVSEIRWWIEGNVRHNWSIDGWSGVIGCILYFENEGDAIAFKLRWL